MPLHPLRKSVPVNGMNTTVPERSMTDEFAPVLQDVWYDDGITLRRRLSQANTNTTAIAGSGTRMMMEHSKLVGSTITKELFLQADDGVLYKTDNVLDTYTTTGLTSTGTMRHTKGGNFTIVGDGLMVAKVYDGTSWTTPVAPTGTGTSVIGSMFHVHKGRCYAAGDPSSPTTVRISSPVNPNNGLGVKHWNDLVVDASGGNADALYVDADLSSPDVITGITTHRGYLVVLCKNHVLFYAMSELDAGAGVSAALYKLIKGEGCVTHDSIQPIGEETFFLSDNGFKKLQTSLVQGDSQVNDLSSPINNVIKELIRGGTVVTSSIKSSYNPKYGLYVCTLGTETWAYQTQFEGWFKWTGIQQTVFTDSDFITYTADTYLCTLENTSFRDEITPTVFVATDMKWLPAPFRSPAVEHRPRWRKFELIYESDIQADSVTISYYSDLDVNTIITATYNLAPTQLLSNGMWTGKFDVPIIGRSELLSFEVSNNSNTDFRFKLLEVYINDTNIR